MRLTDGRWRKAGCSLNAAKAGCSRGRRSLWAVVCLATLVAWWPASGWQALAQVASSGISYLDGLTVRTGGGYTVIDTRSPDGPQRSETILLQGLPDQRLILSYNTDEFALAPYAHNAAELTQVRDFFMGKFDNVAVALGLPKFSEAADAPAGANAGLGGPVAGGEVEAGTGAVSSPASELAGPVGQAVAVGQAIGGTVTGEADMNQAMAAVGTWADMFRSALTERMAAVDGQTNPLAGVVTPMLAAVDVAVAQLSENERAIAVQYKDAAQDKVQEAKGADDDSWGGVGAGLAAERKFNYRPLFQSATDADTPATDKAVAQAEPAAIRQSDASVLPGLKHDQDAPWSKKFPSIFDKLRENRASQDRPRESTADHIAKQLGVNSDPAPATPAAQPANPGSPMVVQDPLHGPSTGQDQGNQGSQPMPPEGARGPLAGTQAGVSGSGFGKGSVDSGKPDHTVSWGPAYAGVDVVDWQEVAAMAVADPASYQRWLMGESQDLAQRWGMAAETGIDGLGKTRATAYLDYSNASVGGSFDTSIGSVDVGVGGQIGKTSSVYAAAKFGDSLEVKGKVYGKIGFTDLDFGAGISWTEDGIRLNLDLAALLGEAGGELNITVPKFILDPVRNFTTAVKDKIGQYMSDVGATVTANLDYYSTAAQQLLQNIKSGWLSLNGGQDLTAAEFASFVSQTSQETLSDFLEFVKAQAQSQSAATGAGPGSAGTLFGGFYDPRPLYVMPR